MTRTLVILSLLAVSACDGVASDEPVSTSTFEATTTASSALRKLRKPDTVRALVQAGDSKLAPTLDDATAKSMQAELDAHRATFRFTPSPQLKPDPGTPATRSFIEDDWTLHVGVAAKLSNYAPECLLSPCVLRLDLDGAGARDAVISAWDKTAKKHVVAVQSNKWMMLGAQVSTLDLRNARWRVVSATELTVPGFTRDGVLIESTTPGVSVRHLLFQDTAGARLVRL